MNKEKLKETINSISIILLIVVLAVLQYGWLFSSTLGSIYTAINVAATVGVLVTAIIVRIYFHIKKHKHK